ncbi:hypothetical protein ACFFX0_10185 [Citricoccus parietis]|uniref:Uncharacterized protein n=1 Tax=Citricoccus parietis TaxID=592307 RepID=A0ABV5FXZ5_9MICC
MCTKTWSAVPSSRRITHAIRMISGRVPTTVMTFNFLATAASDFLVERVGVIGVEDLVGPELGEDVIVRARVADVVHPADGHIHSLGLVTVDVDRHRLRGEHAPQPE